MFLRCDSGMASLKQGSNCVATGNASLGVRVSLKSQQSFYENSNFPRRWLRTVSFPRQKTNAQQRPWDTCFWLLTWIQLKRPFASSHKIPKHCFANKQQLHATSIMTALQPSRMVLFPIRNIILWAKLADERVGVKDSFRYWQCSLPNSCTAHQTSSHMISHQVQSAQKNQENPPSCTWHCNTGMDCDQDVSTSTFCDIRTCSGPTNFFDKLCVFTLLFHNLERGDLWNIFLTCYVQEPTDVFFHHMEQRSLSSQKLYPTEVSWRSSCSWYVL